MLEVADDESIFVLAWAVRALQTGKQNAVGQLLTYPPEAVTSEINSQFSVHPWRIETILNESLATKKIENFQGRPNKRLNTRIWATVAGLCNAVHKLEDSCDAIYLSSGNVLLEMGRIAQRQFEWQRGFLSYAQFYRSAYLYGGDLLARHFTEKYGFSVTDLVQAGFLLYTVFRENHFVRSDLNTEEIELPNERFRAILNLISIQHPEARQEANRLRSGIGHVAYKMSLLREYPCIAFGEQQMRFRAPLPDLIALRCTNGIFYDAVKGGSQIRNEVGARFEKYSCELIQAWLPDYTVAPSARYRIRQDEIDTPDIVVKRDGVTQAIFECKATRMSYLARFSESPFQDAVTGYEEIAKGVLQIWRYVSHVRMGLVPNQKLDLKTAGIVLTLDSWLTMTRPLKSQVLDKARELASRDTKILTEDQIPIIFCPIDDLERTFVTAHDDVFFDVVANANTQKFDGWMLSSIAEQIAPVGHTRNWYPFEDRMAEVLPWWDKFKSKS